MWAVCFVVLFAAELSSQLDASSAIPFPAAFFLAEDETDAYDAFRYVRAKWHYLRQ